MAEKGQLAFIGLGAMGYGMAANLVLRGYSVTGFDVYGPALERFQQAGGKTVASPREAAEGKSVLVVMVATGAQAKTVLFDESTGAIQSLPKNATVIHCSTTAPEHVPELRALLDGEFNRPDVHLVDAPVSGGAIRAAAGTLTILASGPENAISSARDVLETMAGGNLYIIPGGLGAGTKVKMVHQVLAAVHITMASEAMGFAAALGLNTKQVFEGLKGSTGASWMLENRALHLIEDDRTIYSALNIITKDVGIVTTAGRKEKFPLFLSSVAEQVLTVGVRMGIGLEDDGQLIRVYLPQEPKLVFQQAADSYKPRTTTNNEQSLKLVIQILTGVHLAAAAEAMCFGAKVGLDTNTLFDIIRSAAGSSTIFIDRVPQLLTGKWEGIKKTVGDVVEELTEALDEASRIKYPLHLAGTALQLFQLAARRGLEKEADLAVTRLWDGVDGPYFPKSSA